ncbi:MAG TPA: ATP-binding protein [Intrasporangium sp.]|nr:ATP-binding protein [Intrasporangium sp.]
MATRSRESLGWAMLTIAAVAMLGVSGYRATGYGWPAVPATVAIALLLVSAALVAVAGGPRRITLLLVLAAIASGATQFGDDLFRPSPPYLFQVGWVLMWVPAPLLADVLLSYPAGRPTVRGARALLVLTWAWAVLPRLVSSLLWQPPDEGAQEFWFTLWEANAAAVAIVQWSVVPLLALVAWFSWLMADRWKSARGASRGTVRVIAVAGVALAAGVVLRELASLATAREWVSPDVTVILEAAHNLTLGLVPVILAAVTLRAATQRGQVVERLLSVAGDPEQVQDALRAELVDPTLDLRFRLRDQWVSADGLPIEQAGQQGADRIVRLVATAEGEPIALMDAAAHVALDPGRLHLVLATAALVLQNTRLAIEREAHLEELSRSRTRIVEAGIAHRRQLERDLHDGAQQSLLAVAMTLARASLADDNAMREVVDEARQQLTRALAELRDLAHGIHPAALSQGGLATGLAALAPGVPGVTVSVAPDVRAGTLPPTVESTAYFVVAEALANALKHGGAGDVTVGVRLEGSTVTAEVIDDGPGGAAIVPGGGLAGLRDRVQALGGRLEVHSSSGRGTRVRATLPVADPGSP